MKVGLKKKNINDGIETGYAKLRVQSLKAELEKEETMCMKLEEAKRKLQYERQMNEERELELVESIEHTKQYERELQARRLKREKLQDEVDKQVEIERMRNQRLYMLESEHNDLSLRYGNLRQYDASMNDYHETNNQENYGHDVKVNYVPERNKGYTTKRNHI